MNWFTLPSEECYFGNCSDCPGASPLIEDLESIFERKFVEEIQYRQ